MREDDDNMHRKNQSCHAVHGNINYCENQSKYTNVLCGRKRRDSVS